MSKAAAIFEITIKDAEELLARFDDENKPSPVRNPETLKRAGLVKSDKRGREVYYSFDREAMIECCGKQFKAFAIKIGKC